MFSKNIVRILGATFVLHFFLAEAAVADGLHRGVTVGSRITANDIAELGDWEANVVRYPLEGINLGESEDAMGYYARIDRGLRRLDGVLPQFEAQGIKVIVELYSPPGGFSKPTGGPHRVFQEAWAQQALINGWLMIADHYKNSNAVWGYDLLNEPAQDKVKKPLLDWNRLSAVIATNVRAIDSSHKIIIESIHGNPILVGKLKYLALPNIVYSAHIYVPSSFVHQGLYGYPLNVAYPSKKANRKELVKVLKPVMKFQKKYGAEIYIGEFSVVRWAPGNSAYNYLADVIGIMEQNGWNWTYHAYRETNAWSVEHTTDQSNPSPSLSTTDREMLLRQYFHYND